MPQPNLDPSSTTQVGSFGVGGGKKRKKGQLGFVSAEAPFNVNFGNEGGDNPIFDPGFDNPNMPGGPDFSFIDFLQPGSGFPGTFGSMFGPGDLPDIGFDFEDMLNKLQQFGPKGGGNTAGSADFLKNIFGGGAPGLDPSIFGKGNQLANLATSFDINQLNDLITGPEELQALLTSPEQLQGLLGQKTQQFGDILGGNQLIGQLLNSVGLGGGGDIAGRIGGILGKGGNGSNDIQSLLESINLSPGNLSGSDLFGSDAGNINFNFEDLAKLRQLDPSVQGELDAIKASQMAEFEQFRGEERDKLLTQLFGKGVNRSTVAGEAGDRLSRSLERTLLDIEGQSAERELGLRSEQTNRALQGALAGLQSDTALTAERLGAKTSRENVRDQLRAGLLESSKNREAATSSESEAAKLNLIGNIFGSQSGALANIFGSEAGALAGLAGANTAGLSNVAGSQAGALSSAFSNLANIPADLAGQFLNLAGQQQATQSGFLGNLAGVAGGLLGGANANALQGALGNQGALLQLLGLQQGAQGLTQQGILTQQGFDVDKFIAQLQAQSGLDIAGMNKPSSFDKLLGIGATLLPLFFGAP